MPVTPFQIAILKRLAANRSPESVAGGIALNAHELTRWSADVDVFHDAEEAVMWASDADIRMLDEGHYAIRQEVWTPSFRRAWVARGDEGVKLEWCKDSAWRFFPIERDELLGWKLHWFDAVTNKALAMGSRAETRDLVDIVTYASRCPLHAVIWAACTKDPGFGPLPLLSQQRRHSRVDPLELHEMRVSLDPQSLKTQWLERSATAGREIERAGAAGIEVGIAFVSPSGDIGWYDQPGYSPHRATLGGALPRIVR